MKFTELAEHAMPAGEVTEWVPTVASDGPGWRPDDRPITHDHELHYRRADGTGWSPDRQSAWLGAVFEIPLPYDHDALGRALRTWWVRHEAFRTTVRSVDDGVGGRLQRVTHGPDGLTAVARRSAAYATGDGVRDHIQKVFDAELSPLTWPHCVVTTVHGTVPSDCSVVSETQRTPDSDAANAETSAGERFVLAFGADHSVMDAYSMLLTISELQRLYAGELDGTDAGLPDIGSHADFSIIDRRIGEQLTVDHPAVERWRDFLAGSGGGFPGFPLPIAAPFRTLSRSGSGADVLPISAVRGLLDEELFEPVRPGPPPPQSGGAVHLMTASDASTLNAHCRRAGYSMQTAIVAALALTNRELTGSPSTRFAMPMHTRHESQFAESVGWYVGVGPLAVEIDGMETLEPCLEAAGSALAITKETSRHPYPRIAQLLGNYSEPRFVISFLDLRFVPGAPEWPEWNARTIRSGVRTDSEVYLWVTRSTTGITVSFRHPGNDVAAESMSRYLETLRTVLEAATTGGIHRRIGHPVVATLPDDRQRHPA
ncbi:condensation domain-containing protein [Gordonia soli]|uniref:Condensation domain-containing protein n=1 Tax=Gordonia soli NBRC 108243 TaxID=1223545 RepID=M0QMY4_9ACTN|nr:condensation domain-containing protein [Gordonia soli]GAC69774.1 hypothetical protein GS4_28_00220 [Gordonia soli NBRC 108243]